MAIETIKEYLVSLGFGIDKNSFSAAKSSIKAFEKEIAGIGEALAEVGVAIAAVGAGFVAAGASVALFAAGIKTAGDKLGNITTGVDKFALSLYTTKENARSLQQVMDAMGIKSLDDLKYINLMPEQRQQFMELRSLAKQMAPDEDTQKGLTELRKLGFEFQKMQIMMASIGLKLLGSIGELMATPLFKKLPVLVQVIVDLIAFLVENIKEDIQAFIKDGVSGLTDNMKTQFRQILGGFFPEVKPSRDGEGPLVDSNGNPAMTLGEWGDKFGDGKKASTGSSAKPGGKNVAAYKKFAVETARQYGIDPAILLALINQESGWNPNARSRAGALGIAQFLPSTAKGMGVNPMDPYSAIPGAAKYLKNAMIHYHGNIRNALASYNHGFGGTDKDLRLGRQFPAETRGYITSILSAADKLRKTEIVLNFYGPTDPQKTAAAVNNVVNGKLNKPGVG